MTYYCNQTKYPKIYCKAYWGAFKGEEDQSIIDNRNEFIKEFNIASYYRMPKYMIRQYGYLMDRNKSNFFDHIETYKTLDNKCIIVNSPYYTPVETETFLKNLGYTEYKPLYGIDKKTFIYVTYIGRN